MTKQLFLTIPFAGFMALGAVLILSSASVWS